jgi:hypothetical protein
MKRLHKTIIASIVALCLVVPSAALAQSSSLEGYSEPRAEIEGSSTGGGDPGDRSGGDPAAETAGSNSLPFTGLDLGLMAAGGVVLAGMGFGMRRLSRAPDAA